MRYVKFAKNVLGKTRTASSRTEVSGSGDKVASVYSGGDSLTHS